MPENTRESSLEKALEQLQRQAEARWGSDYVEQHGDLLRLAARYIVNIGSNLPDAETEPGFYQ